MAGNDDFIDEDEFLGMIKREMTDGQHIRPEKYPNFIARKSAGKE